MQQSPASLNKNAILFSALSDPSRLLILELLGGPREVVCCELASAIKKDVSTTFRHLEILSRAGLIKTRKESRFLYCSLSRPAEVKKLVGFAKKFY